MLVGLDVGGSMDRNSPVPGVIDIDDVRNARRRRRVEVRVFAGAAAPEPMPHDATIFEEPHDLPEVVDPTSSAQGRPLGIDGSVLAVAQQEAALCIVGIVVTPYDMTQVVNPKSPGVDRAGCG